VWIVIALTVVLAAYFGWQVLEALLILTRQGVANPFAAYIPASIVIFVILVAAFAVYRGYRWSLFLYQLGVVLCGVQLLLFAPGLWQSAGLLAGSAGFGAPHWQLLLSMLMPVIQFAISLYGAIVVYQKIYAVRREAVR